LWKKLVYLPALRAGVFMRKQHMAKATTTRGGTRPLHVRLREAEDRTALLKKRMEVAETRKEIRELRARLFRR